MHQFEGRGNCSYWKWEPPFEVYCSKKTRPTKGAQIWSSFFSTLLMSTFIFDAAIVQISEEMFCHSSETLFFLLLIFDGEDVLPHLSFFWNTPKVFYLTKGRWNAWSSNSFLGFIFFLHFPSLETLVWFWQSSVDPFYAGIFIFCQALGDGSHLVSQHSGIVCAAYKCCLPFALVQVHIITLQPLRYVLVMFTRNILELKLKHLACARCSLGFCSCSSANLRASCHKNSYRQEYRRLWIVCF